MILTLDTVDSIKLIRPLIETHRNHIIHYNRSEESVKKIISSYLLDILMEWMEQRKST